MRNALVYAEDELTLRENLPKFIVDKNYLDCKVLALLTDNPTKTSLNIEGANKFHPGFPSTLEVFKPGAVNKFVYTFVDAIFILNVKNPGNVIPLFAGLGVSPQKIILWTEQSTIDPLSFKQPDGTQVVCFEGLEFHLKNPVDENFMLQTLARLKNQKVLHNIPREDYPSILKDMYQRWMGRELDLDNPKTYTEKINWLKLYDSTPLKGRLSDKFAVREWVENKIGEGHLAPLIGAWDSFDEINFDELPDRFVLKCNHGSGMNYFVPDKSKLNVREAREQFNSWLATDYGMTQLELSYSLIKRKILAEKYIDELAEDVILYRIYCFDGEPKFIRTSSDWTDGHHMFRQKFYDCQWRDLGWTFENYLNRYAPLPKPERFEEMLEYARILSKGFKHARADLYDLPSGILFSEMTFFSDMGFIPYQGTWTYERDLEIGNMIKL